MSQENLRRTDNVRKPQRIYSKSPKTFLATTNVVNEWI